MRQEKLLELKSPAEVNINSEIYLNHFLVTCSANLNGAERIKAYLDKAIERDEYSVDGIAT